MWDSYISQFQNEKSGTVQDTVSNNKIQTSTQQIDGTTKVKSEDAQNPEVIHKKTNSRKKEMPIGKQTNEQKIMKKKHMKTSQRK